MMNAIRPVGKLNLAGRLLHATINGTEFTGHALDQMQSRGIISPTAVIEAVNNPTSTVFGKPSFRTIYFKDNLKVVTESNGKVIVTVMKQSK